MNFSSIKPGPKKKNYFFKQNFKFQRLYSLIVPFWLSQVVMSITERVAKKELSYTGLNPSWHFVLRLASGHIFSLTPQWFLKPEYITFDLTMTLLQRWPAAPHSYKRLHKKTIQCKDCNKDSVFWDSQNTSNDGRSINCKCGNRAEN